jgi:hypothetical protein
MHASIHRYEVTTGSADELADLGWRLGTMLGQVAGFVAAVAVEDGLGALVTISVFEDQTSLAAAHELGRRWAAEHRAALGSGPRELANGEVVAQRGL